jgi:hypothetical protein
VLRPNGLAKHRRHGPQRGLAPINGDDRGRVPVPPFGAGFVLCGDEGGKWPIKCFGRRVRQQGLGEPEKEEEKGGIAEGIRSRVFAS